MDSRFYFEGVEKKGHAKQKQDGKTYEAYMAEQNVENIVPNVTFKRESVVGGHRCREHWHAHDKRAWDEKR